MKLGSNLVKNTGHFQNCGSESLKNMGFPFRHYIAIFPAAHYYILHFALIGKGLSQLVVTIFLLLSG